MKTIIKFKIAEHEASGCRLMGGHWIMDASVEEQFLNGSIDYDRYADIIDEDSEYYNADDSEQEHDEDYRIVEEEIELEYTQEDLDQYENEKENYEGGRNSYYGYAMNGGGGKKEFQNMYGDGEFHEFGKWLLLNSR